MELLSSPTNYKPESFAESPYLRAKRDWDERIGTSVNQARNWRFLAVGLMFISLTLSGLSIVQVTQNKVIPMVITVNENSGEALVLGKAGESVYKPGEAQIRYFLIQFVKFVRSVPSDPIVIKNNWLQAYKFLRSEAALTLNLITNDDESGPLKKIGEETVAIQPISVLYVEGSKSYQARWSETVFDKNGDAIDTYTMTGLFTIESEPPTTEEAVLVNPLGIFIKSFQWNRDLGERAK
jgi:type IV secretory pathway TrbF-like protein